MRFFLFLILLLFHINAFSLTIEFKTETFSPNKTKEDRVLFVQSTYGSSYLNVCNIYYLNYFLNRLNHNLFYNISLDMLLYNSNPATEKFEMYLQNKIISENYKTIIFSNMFEDFCLNEFIFNNEQNYFSIGFENYIKHHIQLYYNFSPFFDFIRLLNLENVGSKIFYFYNYSNSFSLKDKVIIEQLEQLTFGNLIKVPISSTNELTSKLMKLNKTDEIDIVIFNIEFLYSDVYVRLLSIPEILNIINTYNKRNIVLNLSSNCIYFDYLESPFNLTFDLNSYNLNLSEIELNKIESKFVINLNLIYQLELLNNVNSNKLIELFKSVDKIL